MTNIFDVAKKANVSKSTVSRVFSGSRHVSEESRQKIITAADELGYVPNVLARQMRQQKTNIIGFVATSYYPAVGSLLSYITHIAEEKGYSVNVYFTKDKEQELNVLNYLKLHVLDGLFLVSTRNGWNTIKEFAKYGPISTWRRIDSCSIYSSYIDHYPLYKQILLYIENTYDVDSIGHILNDRKKSNTKARIKAINEFEHDYPCTDNDWQLYFPEQGGAGRQAALTYLKTTNPPKVVLAYSDYVAADFISTLREHKVNVPRDVKVFGFDNSDFGKYMNISTVDTYLEIQAINCINNIISRLENKKFEEIKITPKLIIRTTC